MPALADRPPPAADNDGTFRHAIWRRLDGDEWEAFDALPERIRRRLHEHAYDPWTVNALHLWRRHRLRHRSPARAERALLLALDHCERLERAAFAAAWTAQYNTAYPHDDARASVLRYHRMPA